MITCPECGAQNGDDTKFCDRCGQGLGGASARPAAAAALPPLADGAELKGGFRIVELISKTAHENRYRAERIAADGSVERFQLREQIGPDPANGEALETRDSPQSTGGAEGLPVEDDPSGPRAKTAELKITPAEEPAPAPAERQGASGGLAMAVAEGTAKAESPAVESLVIVEPVAAKNGNAGPSAASADAVTLTEEVAPAAAAEPQADAVADNPPADAEAVSDAA